MLVAQLQARELATAYCCVVRSVVLYPRCAFAVWTPCVRLFLVVDVALVVFDDLAGSIEIIPVCLGCTPGGYSCLKDVRVLAHVASFMQVGQ